MATRSGARWVANLVIRPKRILTPLSWTSLRRFDHLGVADHRLIVGVQTLPFRCAPSEPMPVSAMCPGGVGAQAQVGFTPPLARCAVGAGGCTAKRGKVDLTAADRQNWGSAVPGRGGDRARAMRRSGESPDSLQTAWMLHVCLETVPTWGGVCQGGSCQALHMGATRARALGGRRLGRPEQIPAQPGLPAAPAGNACPPAAGETT
jgi:hypothetical protein